MKNFILSLSLLIVSLVLSACGGGGGGGGGGGAVSSGSTVSNLNVDADGRVGSIPSSVTVLPSNAR
jgi:hypothetical protein